MMHVELIMALKQVKGLGAKTLAGNIEAITKLKTESDAYLFLEELHQRHKRIEVVSAHDFSIIISNIKKILNKQESLGIQIVTIDDNVYPEGFLHVDNKPLYFFAKGNLAALKKRNIAIIGTRNVTDFSKKVGEHLGKYIASKNWAITSGLAEGCDTAGHIGCIQAKGTAIAIVATPLNEIYPKSNTKLQQDILDNDGCVISEYHIGAATSRYNFIERDRLQCGLADGVAVIETGLKGGTWHAINGAIKLNKPVACYKFKDEYYQQYEHSLGNQKMIQNKTADALYDADSINIFLDKCVGKNQSLANHDNSVQELRLF